MKDRSSNVSIISLARALIRALAVPTTDEDILLVSSFFRISSGSSWPGLDVLNTSMSELLTRLAACLPPETAGPKANSKLYRLVEEL